MQNSVTSRILNLARSPLANFLSQSLRAMDLEKRYVRSKTLRRPFTCSVTSQASSGVRQIVKKSCFSRIALNSGRGTIRQKNVTTNLLDLASSLASPLFASSYREGSAQLASSPTLVSSPSLLLAQHARASHSTALAMETP